MKATFLHVADVHLDSPLDHLRQLDERTAAKLQQATRSSFERIVTLAIERSVDAVAIAGDLFDQPVQDAGAALWVDSQFRRLDRERIPVLLIRGNHDAMSNAGRVAQWSTGVHEFGTDRATTVRLDDVGFAFHGQSFGSRAVAEDLAAKYPTAIPGFFNVGLLHTSLAGSSGHDSYAPTSATVLDGLGYNYWGLGHIHKRSLQSESTTCYIGYSGNTQGRSVRETGAKGCQLVTVQDGRMVSADFIATDAFRWEELTVSLTEIDSLGDIEELVLEELMPIADQADGRSLAIRVRLVGATAVHAELTKSASLMSLHDTLSGRIRDAGDVWLERIRPATQPRSGARRSDMSTALACLQQVADSFTEQDHAREELLQSLNELLQKTRAELADEPLVGGDEATKAAELNRIIQSARDLLISRLSSTKA